MSIKIPMQQSLVNQTNKNSRIQVNWLMFQQYPDLYWDTIYIDKKYYIAHPLELDKLKKLEVQIRKQKNRLNMNQNYQDMQKKQNQQITQKSQLDNYRPLSGLSRQCKTQLNETKQMKARIKAQVQLLGQEEKYKMRVAQINKKKKQFKQVELIPSNLKNSRKESSVKSQKEKSMLNSKASKQKQQIISNKIKQSSNKQSQKINQSKLRQSSKKSQDKRSQKSDILKSKQLSKSKVSKSQIKQTESHPQKNYISFHPNEGLNSPKFQLNQTKSGKFIQNQIQQDKQIASLRQSANINSSRMGNKSFVVNLRKTPTNSKQGRQSVSNSRRYLKSASSTTSKVQLQQLNRKIREMQEKLAQVENKQKQIQQLQKSRVLASPQKTQPQNIQKKQSIQAQKPQDQKYQILYPTNNRYNEQLSQKQQQKSQKLQQPGKLQYQIINSNKSSALSNEQKINRESRVFDLTIYKTKKLNLASHTVQYNYSQDLIKIKKQIEEINQKQKMTSQITDLKKMIRQLKLQRIKQQTMIQQLQKKQKQQQSLNMLLISKLDQGTPKVQVSNRIPTQKRQKLQSQQQQKSQLISPEQNKKKSGEIKKVQPIQIPLSKRQKISSLKIEIQTGTQNKSKRSQNLPSIQKANKINMGAKQISSNSAQNPQQVSYREFHPYPLKRKGIVVRQVLQNDKQQKSQKNMSNNKNQSYRDIHDQPSSPLSTGRKIFQLQFVKQTQKKTQILQQQPDLTAPEIKIKAFTIPDLPQAPKIDISQLDLLNLAKYICDIFNIKVQTDDHIYMKKYKNCIIFKTPDAKKTVVWHYTGKFYIGGWDQNQQGEGKKNGQGFEFVPQKHYYQGQFLDGKKNGSGTMIYLNGNIYKGQWFKGLRHGLGTYYEEDSKIVYEGQWKQDKKDGKGILKVSDNQFYDGTFIKTIKHGYGIQLFSNGDYYKGQYKMGRFHGKGRYVWKNGASYDGSFVDGRRQGLGRWKSNKTQYDIYFGQYKNDKKSGKGQYTWNHGTVYEGQFVNDLKHGQGKVQYPDGRQIRGYWQSGKLIQVDQNIQQIQTQSNKNQLFTKQSLSKHLQINSKQLQPSRKLTKF